MLSIIANITSEKDATTCSETVVQKAVPSTLVILLLNVFLVYGFTKLVWRIVRFEKVEKKTKRLVLDAGILDELVQCPVFIQWCCC